MEKTFCPDPEVVAAWIDHGLTPDDRAAVEAHIAGCDDCRLLVVQVLETQDAIGEPHTSVAGPVPAPAPVAAPHPPLAVTGRGSRRLMRWGVGSFLAAAAVWLLSTRAPSTWWPESTASRADSKLADLVDAVQDERTVEARMTGGFRYGPLRALVRSGGSTSAPDNYSLYGAAGKIRREAEDNPTPENLHALGVAQLLLGEHDAAVAALEDAVAESPQNARFQSDLAAAFLTRARQRNRPDDLPRALGASERAIGADAGLLESRFNRALALESMFLEDQARRAWEEYLARDNASEWAEEARRHLAALQRSVAERDRIRNNSPPPLSETTVEAGLDWLLRQGLGAWADAVLSSDADRASRELSHLTTYATDLSTRTRDPFARSLIPAPPTPGGDAAARARATAGFVQALRWLDQDDVARAEERLREICPGIGGSLQLLCDLELGTFDVLRRDSRAAEQHAGRALREARARTYAYVEGRGLRLDGYRLMFQGDYAQSLEMYRAALETFREAGYTVAAGIMAVQLAELYDVIGLPIEAWQWRYQALEAAGRHHSRSLTFLSSLTLARVVSTNGNYLAGRTILPTVRASATSAVQQLPFLFMQVRAALANGDVASADDLLTASENLIATTSDFRATRFKAETATLRALTSWQRGDRREALAQIDAAVAQTPPERSAQRATALLDRARIRLNSSAKSAESDVREALSLLDQRGGALQQVLQFREAGVALDAIAALVVRDASLSATGLDLAERVRQLLDGRPPSDGAAPLDAVADARRRLADGGVALFYLFADDALLTWVVRPTGVQLFVRPLRPQVVEQLASRLSIRLVRAPGRSDLWKPVLATLGGLMLDHLPDDIRRAKELVIIPDAVLSRVPMGALIDHRSGAFLFEQTSIRVAPNLAFAFAVSDPADATRGMLSIGAPELSDGRAHGYPPLRGAQDEATAVAGLYPRAQVLLGSGATRERMLAQLDAADVIHFSGHAVAPTQTTDGRLLLAGRVADPASSLSFRELPRRLRAPRVVLAACDTGGVGSVDRASSLTSLAAGFLRAGARTVVANMWRIDDLVARDFYVAVHQGLVEGRTMADAVARAQRRCAQSPDCRSAPATWLGATVYGTD